jgi:hypothetical protein
MCDQGGRPGARSEFRIGNEALLVDHPAQEHAGADDRHLALDHRKIQAGVGQDGFGARRLLPLRIEQDL